MIVVIIIAFGYLFAAKIALMIITIGAFGKYTVAEVENLVVFLDALAGIFADQRIGKSLHYFIIAGEFLVCLAEKGGAF